MPVTLPFLLHASLYVITAALYLFWVFDEKTFECVRISGCSSSNDDSRVLHDGQQLQMHPNITILTTKAH